MSFDRPIAGPDAPSCRYGASRLSFRGPGVDAAAPHVALIGSSEVLGRHVARPMAVGMAEALGHPVANLGVQNAGIDAFLGDEGLLAAASGATVAVVQAMGAQNQSNRFYSVHPRRNDRFLRQSSRLAGLYPDVDFSDFVFTRHMLGTLRDRDAERFTAVIEELRSSWTARMRRLLAAFVCPTILLDVRGAGADALGPDPLYVTGAMVAGLSDDAVATVRVDVAGLPADARTDGAAMSAQGHEAVATALVRIIGPMIAERTRQTRRRARARRRVA